MSDTLQQLLCKTVAEVYETMFFTFLETAEDSGFTPDPGLPVFLEAAIDLSAQAQKGTVRFYYGETLARHIASNFLGIGADLLDERRMHDTLGEAANMTVGSLLGKLDPRAVCGTIGMPAVRKAGGLTMGDILVQPDTLAFYSNFGWLLMDYGAVNTCFKQHGDRA